MRKKNFFFNSKIGFHFCFQLLQLLQQQPNTYIYNIVKLKSDRKFGDRARFFVMDVCNVFVLIKIKTKYDRYYLYILKMKPPALPAQK